MVSRSRTGLATAAATAALCLLAACSTQVPAPGSGAGSGAGQATGTAGGGDKPVTLTFVGYGGSGQDAMISAWQKPYTQAHPNVTFVNTSPPDVAQVKAQVESGRVQWDVLATAPYAAEQNCGTLFEPLQLDLSAVKGDLVDGAVGKCYIGNWINATPMAYRTDAFPPGKGPKTVADFFDTKNFPGRRGMVTNLQNGILEYALLGDGVAPESLYPLDVDRALKKLGTIRNDTTFAPNVGALQQAVASDQVDVFFLPDSRVVPQLAQGQKLTVVWDVTVASINAFAIPKGSAHKDAAEQFVASVVEPAQVAKISELLGVAPINKKATPKLDANAAQVEVFGKVNTGKTVIQDIPWYAKNFNDVTKKLTNWLAG